MFRQSCRARAARLWPYGNTSAKTEVGKKWVHPLADATVSPSGSSNTVNVNCFPSGQSIFGSYAGLLRVGGHGINRAEVFNCQLLRFDFQAELIFKPYN